MKTYNQITVCQHQISTTRSLDGVVINLPFVRFSDGSTINLYDGTRSVVGEDDIIIDPPVLVDGDQRISRFVRKQFGGILSLNLGSIPGCKVSIGVHKSPEIVIEVSGTNKRLAELLRIKKLDTDLAIDGGPAFAFGSNVDLMLNQSLTLQGQLMSPPELQMTIFVPETMNIKARGVWNGLDIGHRLIGAIEVQAFGISVVNVASCHNGRFIQSGRGSMVVATGSGNLFLRNDNAGDLLVESGEFQKITINSASIGYTIVNAACVDATITAIRNGHIYVRTCEHEPSVLRTDHAEITVNP